MEEEYYDDGDEEGDWEDDDAEEGEEMDVEEMEEEALGAVADLSERLSRELRIGEWGVSASIRYLRHGQESRKLVSACEEIVAFSLKCII